MTSVSSKRPPYPDDVMLGAYGLRLVNGTMVAKKTQSLENVAPTQQEYSSAPVYKERTFSFRPTRGMGERVQSSHTSRRYSHAKNVLVRGGLFGKGPLFHDITPGTTEGPVRHFVEALHSSTLTQFILTGRYVLRRDGDDDGDQVVSLTLGAGIKAMDAVRFQGAYATPVDGLYVSASDGTLREYDGTTWNSCTLPAGFSAIFLTKVGDELWAGGSNQIRKCTGDPKLAASWSGPITVGDESRPITALGQTMNRLAIFKDDGGIFTLNGDGSDNDLFPGLRITPDGLSGDRPRAWAGLDGLYVRIGLHFYRLSMLGGPELTPVGPERMQQNTSEVSGPVQFGAFAGWGVERAFVGISNGSDSFLLSYGAWQSPIEGEDAAFTFADQYDGAEVVWTGKTVSALAVSDLVANNTRLYAGFSDGTYGYLKLVANPFASGSGAEFTSSTSEIFMPLHHAMFQADWKTTNGFSAFGPLLTNTDYVQMAYRMDGSTAAYTSVAGSITTTGQRLDTPVGTVGHVLDAKVTLVNTTTADTPVLEGIAIHESVRPALKRDIAGVIDARNRVARRDGSTSRLTAEQIRDIVLQAAGAPGSITLTLPDERVQGFSFFGYTETLLPRQQRNSVGWQIEFQATEFQTNTVHGTFGRLTGVTFGDLAGVTFAQISTW